MRIIGKIQDFISLLKRDGKITCPDCGKRLVPLPVYDGDTVGGEVKQLDRRYIHFMCYCGHIFARQEYGEFVFRSRWGLSNPLHYPCWDMKGKLLPRQIGL